MSNIGVIRIQYINLYSMQCDIADSRLYGQSLTDPLLIIIEASQNGQKHK